MKLQLLIIFSRVHCCIQGLRGFGQGTRYRDRLWLRVDGLISGRANLDDIRCFPGTCKGDFLGIHAQLRFITFFIFFFFLSSSYLSFSPPAAKARKEEMPMEMKLQTKKSSPCSTSLPRFSCRPLLFCWVSTCILAFTSLDFSPCT